MNSLLKIRILEIQIVAKAMTWIGQRPAGRSLILWLRSHVVTRCPLEVLLGYRRTFKSMAESQACASRYGRMGHEHPEEIRFHAGLASSVRESDYPVLFYLKEQATGLRTVFDLGGNVGNLFYAFQTCLRFSENLVWKILELPEPRRLGNKLALERNEKRIRYVDSLAEASGVDLFIASGSLHYFEPSLAEMLSPLAILPRRVVVNRTPCSLGGDVITVQDAMSSVVPCKLHSRTKLVAGMEELGYVLRGEWPVHERRLWVPLYPECSSSHYHGFYFVLGECHRET